MDFGLKEAIERAKRENINPVIAEIKPYSPIHGDLLRGRDPIAIAAMYENSGAAALSYITAKEFYGNVSTLREICRFTSLPVLRKDFITDAEEIEKSSELGVSAILLIARLLRERTMEFVDLCISSGIEAVVEIHRKEDLEFVEGERLLYLINNRDIARMEMDEGNLDVTAKLSPHVRGMKISGSGIKGCEDVKFVLKYADAALIGTSLMVAGNTKEFLRKLVFGR